jgi:hypothetical protein
VSAVVLVSNQDQSALAEPAALATRRAPRGELVRVPGGHCATFTDMYEESVAADLAFLHRNLGSAD